MPNLKNVPDDAVYIGAGTHGTGSCSSPWAAPFPIKLTEDRHAWVQAYAAWLYSQPVLLEHLHELAGWRLACDCQRKEACHGDALLLCSADGCVRICNDPAAQLLAAPADSIQPRRRPP